MADTVVWLKDHARATAGSRAAKVVRSSAVTPAPTARSVRSTSDQYSGGMLSRCHHFDIWVAVVPGNSAAIASREFPHSSMIERNEVKSVMTTLIGQMVLKYKALPSLDCGLSLGHTVPMAESDTEDQFKQEFTGRVKAARASLGWKQWQMADALGMPQDKYKQYEGRSLLPHHLIGRFCLVTHIDPEWLMTGRGKKPMKPLAAVAGEPQPTAKPRRARATRAA